MRCPGPLGSCSPVCSLAALCCVYGVLGHLASVHRFGCSICFVAHAVSWYTWVVFTGMLARCVVLRVRCPWSLGSFSPVCSLGVLCCVCGVLGHWAPVHRCARSMRCVACTISWAISILFTGVPAWCVVVRVRGVLGHLARVHQCARSACCVVVWCCGPLGSCSPVCPLGALCCLCATFWATWLLFTGVLAWCVVLRVRCPGPLDSCSPVRPLRALCCVCGVLGHLAPVLRCARSVRCVACVVSWATWRLFTSALAQCVVSPVRCPGPLGSCSPVCSLRALCCVCGVLGHLAPVLRCAR